jgi:hypothetical protein
LARSETATLEGVADHLLHHAVGLARHYARGVGATVIALDPYDEETDQMWRARYGFRASATPVREGRPKRLWNVLFPN